MEYFPVAPKKIPVSNQVGDIAKFELWSLKQLYPNESLIIDDLNDDIGVEQITGFKYHDFIQNTEVSSSAQIMGYVSQDLDIKSKTIVRDIIAYKEIENKNDNIIKSVIWGFGIRINYKIFNADNKTDLDFGTVGLAIEAGIVNGSIDISGLGLKNESFAKVLRKIEPFKRLAPHDIAVLLYELFVKKDATDISEEDKLIQATENPDESVLDTESREKKDIEISERVVKTKGSAKNVQFELLPIGVKLKDSHWFLNKKSVPETIIKAFQHISMKNKLLIALLDAQKGGYDPYFIKTTYQHVIGDFDEQVEKKGSQNEVEPSYIEKKKAAEWLQLQIHDL